MPVQFSVPDVLSERLLKLISDYASCSKDSISITVDPTRSEVDFVTADGTSVKGVVAAARYVASLGSRADQLLGSNEHDCAKISESLTFVRHAVSTLWDSKLEAVNAWLLHRTFLVGNVITLADLVLYAGVHGAVTSFPKAQHGHFCNLLRWYDNIHYMADPESVFPGVCFTKPKFAFKHAAPVVSNADTKKKTAESAKTKKEAETAPAPITPAISAANENTKKNDTLVEKKKEKAEKKKGGSSAASDPTVDVLDIRVGVITHIGPHPNADSLYVEEIDLGEEKPRTVVSGLRKFVTEADMQGRKVVVVCNLKPAKMRDVMSYGMVLCASNDDHTQVDPIIPPDGSKPGDKVFCPGYDGEPEMQINPKKKIFEKIAPYLKTSQDGVCKYKDAALSTSAGPVKATLQNASIA